MHHHHTTCITCITCTTCTTCITCTTCVHHPTYQEGETAGKMCPICCCNTLKGPPGQHEPRGTLSWGYPSCCSGLASGGQPVCPCRLPHLALHPPPCPLAPPWQLCSACWRRVDFCPLCRTHRRASDVSLLLASPGPPPARDSPTPPAPPAAPTAAPPPPPAAPPPPSAPAASASPFTYGEGSPKG